MPHPSNPTRLRFSLRTLFMVVTVVAVVVGWICYHLNWIRDRHAMLAELPNYAFATSPPHHFPFGLKLLGERAIFYIQITVTEPNGVASHQEDVYSLEQAQRIERLFPEADVARVATH